MRMGGAHLEGFMSESGAGAGAGPVRQEFSRMAEWLAGCSIIGLNSDDLSSCKPFCKPFTA